MEETFLQIYNLYKNDIFRLCLSYTKSIEDSEDITQNVFLKLYKNLSKLEEEKIKNWLIKVTINECKNHLLTNWYKKVTLLTNDQISNYKAKVKEEDKTIEKIMNLPKTDRLIIHLYYYENYKVKEIANLLKKTESNIKVRMYRIRKKIGEQIMEDFNEK